jgi:hypothetical protein
MQQLKHVVDYLEDYIIIAKVVTKNKMNRNHQFIAMNYTWSKVKTQISQHNMYTWFKVHT